MTSAELQRPLSRGHTVGLQLSPQRDPPLGQVLPERPARGSAGSAQLPAGKSNPWFAVAPQQLAASWPAHSSAR